MKYCLRSRQLKRYLSMADEIVVESRDYRQISDLFIDYPDKMIILEISNEDLDNEEYMNVVEEYGKATENFCCKIYNLQKYQWFKARNIKFYYGYPINSYYDMKGLIDLGVEYIFITAPLTFDMSTMEKYDVKFRAVPNIAYDAYIPRNDGKRGQWIRPEDIKYYENGIYVFEFEDANLEKERTLYDVYKSGEWPGNINLLITNLGVNADNRGIIDEFGQVRSNCRQRCMSKGSCHFCDTAFDFEEMLRIVERRRALEKLQESQPQEEN